RRRRRCRSICSPKSIAGHRSSRPQANTRINSRLKEKSKMATYTWDHVHLKTPDPEEMAQWFQKMLGAEIVRTMQQGKERIDVKIGGANVFIAESDGHNAPPEISYRGLEHFGLLVSGIDAVAAEL